MNKVGKNIKFAGLAITIFVLLAGNCYGQNITWDRTYLQSSASTTGYSIKQTIDGNYIICGARIGYGGFVCKLNLFGDTLWVRYTPYSQMQSIVEASDGNYVAIGYSSNLYIVKYSPNGSIIWSNSITEPGNEIFVFHIINTNDNCFLVCGYTRPSGYRSAYYIKIDNNGNKIWSKFITPVNNGIGLNNAAMTSDNGFILTGGITINNNTQIYLLRTDQNGDTLWSKQFGSPIWEDGNSVYQTNNNGFIVFGNIYYSPQNIRLYFLKTDVNGNLEWSKIYGDTNTLYMMLYGENAVKSKFDNSYFISGTSTNYPALDTNKIFLLKLDTAGNKIWENKYKKDTLDLRGFAIDQTSDSGFVVSGDAFYSSVEDKMLSDPQLLYVLKLDKQGQLNPIGINPISGNIPYKYELFQNYPNPFNPITIIKFNMPKDVNVNIRIYDVLGKDVFNFNEFKKAGSYEVQFNGTNLASGMYFYKLETEGFTDTKIMVLLK